MRGIGYSLATDWLHENNTTETGGMMEKQQTAKSQVTSMVAELVELRNLLLTPVNDFARAKQYFGAEYLKEVDGTYKVSRDGPSVSQR